jgi:hypothetical protein
MILDIPDKFAFFVIYFGKNNASDSAYREIRVITKLPNSEQSNKGKVKTHKSLNRQKESTTGNLDFT